MTVSVQRRGVQGWTLRLITKRWRRALYVNRPLYFKIRLPLNPAGAYRRLRNTPHRTGAQ